MSNSSKRPARVARGVGLAVVAATAIGVSQPAQANSVIDEIGHFISCFGWMLTDPATHVANCGGRSPPESLSSLATPVASSAPILGPAPPPPSGSGSSGGSCGSPGDPGCE